MRPSSPPLRTRPARTKRGGFQTGGPKLSPGVAGRSSSASSEHVDRPLEKLPFYLKPGLCS